MLCEQCGNPLEATDRFCDRCGAVVKTVAEPVSEQPKKKRKGMSEIAIVAMVISSVAAVAAAAIFAMYLWIGTPKPGARSPEAAAEQALIAVLTKDGQALLNLTPDELAEWFADRADVDVDNREKLAKKMADSCAQMYDFAGKNKEVTVHHIVEGERIGRADLKAYLEQCVQNGFSRKEVEKVTAARTFDIIYTVGNDDQRAVRTYVFEYEGRWYWWDMTDIDPEEVL